MEFQFRDYSSRNLLVVSNRNLLVAPFVIKLNHNVNAMVQKLLLLFQTKPYYNNYMYCICILYLISFILQLFCNSKVSLSIFGSLASCAIQILTIVSGISMHNLQTCTLYKWYQKETQLRKSHINLYRNTVAFLTSNVS